MMIGGLQRPSHERSASPDPVLAVLPLENLSGGSEQEYFAEGMTDQLIAGLATVGGLRVISRTSVMHYKTARKPVPTIAKELNIDAIIEGTVVEAGGVVRITAKLIRGPTGEICGRRISSVTSATCSPCRATWLAASPAKSVSR